MRARSPLRLAFLLAGLSGAGAAAGETADCQRYKAELASLGRGGAIGALRQQRQEIARLGAYYQLLGCGRGHFLFFGPSPAECHAVAQRINALHAGQARLASREGDTRRRQLKAAVARACAPQQHEEARALGGSRLVCVRTCDGSFFPLHNLPKSRRADADDMCRALCPAGEAAAYRMPSDPDADLGQAISLSGKRYTRLANAFKYQTSFDPGCSCRKQGQSWAEALAKAEKMIERGRGDIIVTVKKAEELSRPRLTRKRRKSEPQIAAKPLDVETTGSIAPKGSAVSPAAASAVAAAAAQASGAKSPPEQPDRAVPGGDAKQAAAGQEGARRRPVRVIGPAFISLPEAAAD
jgi:hypothetical protein